MKKILRKIWDGFTLTVMGIFGLAIAVFGFKFLCYLTMIGIFMANDIFTDMNQKQINEFEITAMKDNNTYITSRYSGDSELKYYYMREVNGSIYTGEHESRDSSIVEDGQNKVKVFIEVPKYGEKAFLFFQDMASMDGQPMVREHYEFHIPKDSVEQDFKVDLE